MIRGLHQTSIEWVLNPDGTSGFSYNPITGCLGPDGDGRVCRYCYAKTVAENRLRGKAGYPKEEPFSPTFHADKLDAPKHKQKPSGIFTVDMGDLWGDWVKREDIEKVLQVAHECPQHVFYMLTKNPRRYLEFVDDWPVNAWAGATVDMDSVAQRADDLRTFKMKRAQVSGTPQIVFLSVEPMLTSMAFLSLTMIDWMIIGGLSRSKYRPPGWNWGVERVPPNEIWVKQLLRTADTWGVKVFMKNNLPWDGPLRREHPLLGRK
jgi:protein gp37